MVIFNLYAIVVAVFIVLGALPFIALSHYGIISEDLSLVISSWVTLAICGLCHKVGIKGRLFYVPMWILAIPLAFLLTFAKYGWTGIIGVVGPVVGLLGLLFYLAYRSEKKRAENIAYEPEDLPYDESNPAEFWTAFKEKIFLPTFVRLNPQICDFNARVARKAELYPLNMGSLSAFRTEMDAHSRVFDKKRLNKDLIQEFTDEIDAKLEAAEKNSPSVPAQA